MKCPICGAETKGNTCEFCGAELPKTMPDKVVIDNSNETRTVINNYYQASPSTPTRSYANVSTQKQKSKMVALVLCIFFGYFGVHYFYAGKIGMGILYVFTIGLCGIGWIVDIVRIATGTFTDSRGLKLV